MLGLRGGWLWAEDMAGQVASAANTAIVAKRFMTIPLFGRLIGREAASRDAGRGLTRASFFSWSHFRTENRFPLFLKMLYFACSSLSQFVALTFCRRSWSTYGRKVSRNERCSCRYSHRQLLARRSGSDFFTNANFTLSPPYAMHSVL